MEKKPHGRPSDYDPKFCEIAFTLAQQGATDREISEELGCSEPTFYSWAAKHPEFRQSVKLGKEASDDRVERSFYHRAVGYTFQAVKVFQHQGQPVVVPYTEHVPPDPSAALNWLKNRRPDVWREKVEHEHVIDISPEDRVEIARRMAFLLAYGERNLPLLKDKQPELEVIDAAGD